ncbi:hypothetical protein [Chryseobacterium sp. ERMR1:04]|uniref:hypothetical protein n=1 Tax=Chryseobacterium sp. ERMR1:04 TaxID=1705393 RepID=UPI0006C837BC|nr:hypothetical protein [Chryseobacterium sp. ERMR1:04]KPH12957.1 hypothetical protein AMQ68_10630 [Chryseobacterium sp. ERMR1:04]
MKKILALGIVLIMTVSCTNGDFENASSENNQNSTVSKTAKKTTTIVTLSTSPISPSCYNDISLDNKNLQLQISQPAPYDIKFTLTLKQKNSNGNYLSVPNPWAIVLIPKGETWATIDTVCQIEGYVPCGKITEIRTGNFKLEITNAKYFFHGEQGGDIFNYEYNSGVNTIDFTFKKSCMGGGWIPDEPK